MCIIGISHACHVCITRITRVYRIVCTLHVHVHHTHSTCVLQAYMFLKFALAFTEKIKRQINPLTGEPLQDQTGLVEEFWKVHSTKLSTLCALVSVSAFINKFMYPFMRSYTYLLFCDWLDHRTRDGPSGAFWLFLLIWWARPWPWGYFRRLS